MWRHFWRSSSALRLLTDENCIQLRPHTSHMPSTLTGCYKLTASVVTGSLADRTRTTSLPFRLYHFFAFNFLPFSFPFLFDLERTTFHCVCLLARYSPYIGQ